MNWFEWFQSVGPVFKDYSPFLGVCVVAIASGLIAWMIESHKFKFKKMEIQHTVRYKMQIEAYQQIESAITKVVNVFSGASNEEFMNGVYLPKGFRSEVQTRDHAADMVELLDDMKTLKTVINSNRILLSGNANTAIQAFSLRLFAMAYRAILSSDDVLTHRAYCDSVFTQEHFVELQALRNQLVEIIQKEIA